MSVYKPTVYIAFRDNLHGSMEPQFILNKF